MADVWQNVINQAIPIIILLLIFALFIYFFPSFVAQSRHKRQLPAIFCLNFFLGYTLLGWVAALVWAVLKEESDGS